MNTHVQTQKHLVPVKIVKVDRFFMVHLLDPERLDLDRGFFRDALPEKLPVDRIVELKQWLLENDANGTQKHFGDTACIFHVARCGSTLLARNLRANSNCVVLSEPCFLGKTYQLLSDQDPSILRATLRQ